MKNVLAGTTVVELAMGIAGPYATKTLADQGARVIKVEPLGGDPIRCEGTFLDKNNWQESGSQYLFFNTSKESITLNLETQEGQRILEKLIAKADICVEGFAPSESERLGVTYDRFSKHKPGLVMTSVTPFGYTGPYKDMKSTELILQALSGFLYLAGGYHETPIQVAMNQAQVTAGRYAVIGTLAAYYHAQKQKQGQHVDVSIWESFATMAPNQFTQYVYTGTAFNRGPDSKSIMDGDFLLAQDGYVCLTTGGGNTMEKWAIFFECFELLQEEFETVPLRNQNWRQLEELFKPVLAKWTRKEFMTKSMDERFVVGTVQRPEELLDCEQLAARETWFDVTHPVVGTLKYPGPGYKVNDTNPIAVGARPAPLLGQHTAQVLSELGYTDDAIVRLRQASVI